MSYAGESIQKKIARAYAYRGAAELTRGVHGGIVCLAGPGAHDVGPLAEFFPGAPVMFVDYDSSCLDDAKRRVPDAVVFHGGLRDADPPWPVRLAVLDFCGHLEGDNFAGAVNIMRRMPFGAVALITTLRGREAGGARSTLLRALPSDGVTTRCVADGLLLGQALGLFAMDAFDEFTIPPRTRVLVKVGAHAYNGPRSPMMIAAYQKTSACAAGARWRRVDRKASRVGWPPSTGTTADYMRARRTDGPAAALASGFTARALDVSERTMAAWRAHATMGTYAKEPA